MMGSCCVKAVFPGSTICSLLNLEAFEIDVSLITTVGRKLQKGGKL